MNFSIKIVFHKSFFNETCQKPSPSLRQKTLMWISNEISNHVHQMGFHVDEVNELKN